MGRKGTKLANQKKISEIGACTRAHEPENMRHGLFLIKGGISGQIDKNKSYKGYKVRQPTKKINQIGACTGSRFLISRQSDKN
jgi:hypothetical protein